MTRNDDFIGQLEGYLDEYEGITPLPGEVRDAVRAQLPSINQRSAWWPGRMFLPVGRMVRVGVVAAAVVVAVALGYNYIGANLGGFDPIDGSPVAEPSPAPNPPCMNPFSESDEVRLGPLEPGTYVCYAVGGGNMNVQFSVPAGWAWQGSYLRKGEPGSPEEARISFFQGDLQVYTDPCHWVGAEPDAPTRQSVSALVDALAAQPTRAAAAPSERYAYGLGSDTARPPSDSDNGWAGMVIELSVPAEIDFAECDGGQFRSWGPDPNVRAHQGPGQRDVVWAVDLQGNGVYVPGERLVIDASSMPATPPNVLSEIEAILESLRVGHWG